MYGVLLTSVSLADLGQCESIWNHVVGCECHKNPLLEGVGLVPVGGFSVLGGKKDKRWSCPSGGFPAISQGRMVDWPCPWKIKAFQLWWVALLAP